MKNELTKSDANQIALLDDRKLSDVIKPLSRDIHLFDSFVSGVSNIKEPDVLKQLKEGQKLILQREDSKFDSNTINILTEEKVKIGYVPEKDNVVFARLMDAGKLLSARISSIQFKGPVPVIAIGIYMTDY